MTGATRTTHSSRNFVLAAGGSALLAVLGTLGVLSWAGWLARPQPQASHQEMVHDMGAHVMPFDLEKTTHVFEMTENGGIQQVVADDPGDSAQIALIQQHIQHESVMFSEGNFADPTSLHGTDMPGLKELASGATQMKIEYAPLPSGAQITFTAQDPHLVTATHRWFGAQLSEHGSDATSR